MALFFECMPQCAQKVFDTADIVRDRDFAPVETIAYRGGSFVYSPVGCRSRMKQPSAPEEFTQKTGNFM
jgi:hypothetical protein